jgi:hypothetical protein
MPTARFKAKGKTVSFSFGKKSKGKGGRLEPKGRKGTYELWSIHDGGDREVRRWKGTTEKAGEKRGAELARERGWLLDLLRCDGKKKIHLRTFGG